MEFNKEKQKEKFSQIYFSLFFLSFFILFLSIVFNEKIKSIDKNFNEKINEIKSLKNEKNFLEEINEFAKKVNSQNVNFQNKEERKKSISLIPVDKQNKNWMNEFYIQGKVKKEIEILLDSIKIIPHYQTSSSSPIFNHCLFFGPPGSGKSYLAEILAKNESCGYDFANFETVLYTGSSIKKQQETLNKAREILKIEKLKNKGKRIRPFFIIIDEIDSVGIKGVEFDNKASTQETNGLLKMIDEINREGDEIIVIGITNYPEKLEEALTRSGRLGKKIEFSYLDDNEMSVLFNHFSEKTKNNDWKFFESVDNNNKDIWKLGDEDSQMIINWEGDFWEKIHLIIIKIRKEVKKLKIGLSIVDFEQVINECICLGKKEGQKITPSSLDFEKRLNVIIENKKKEQKKWTLF